MMQNALKVLTDRMLFAHIGEFQSGLPFLLLAFEPDVYAAETKNGTIPRRDVIHPDTGAPDAAPGKLAGGASFLHHALVSDNHRVVDMLLDMHEQSYYASMPRFALDGVLELVCKQGRARHLKRLHGKPRIPELWPSTLLRLTLEGLESTVGNCAEDQTAKSKAEWLMKHHPEACTEIVKAGKVLLSEHGQRAFLLKLLASDAVDLTSFEGPGSYYLDVGLLEVLLETYPHAITHGVVKQCARYGNLDAVKFFHDNMSQLPEGIFTSGVMDAAAGGGHLDVVRFLHEHRTEGCTVFAIDGAAYGRHLDVVKFLVVNRTEGFSASTFTTVTRFGGFRDGSVEVTQYLAEQRPDLIRDPTTWRVNEATKCVRSAWAKTAMLSDDPVEVLRAAVIKLTDVEQFQQVHEQKHPRGCTDRRNDDQESLLQLAIDGQKDGIATYLVENCEHVRSSINYYHLRAAGSDSRPLNLALLDLLMAHVPRGQEAEQNYDLLLRRAAKFGNTPFLKALLARGLSCTHEILMEALYGDELELGEYLMERYPEFIDAEVLHQIAYRGDVECLIQLQVSHPHLWDMSMLDAILCGENTPEHTTWTAVRRLYEHFSSMPLKDETARLVWREDDDDVLLFMWLGWRDPKLEKSFVAAHRLDRLHLYTRLRACVPSLFKNVPGTLPWCCQLQFLRDKVDNGRLTLEDVERARGEVVASGTDSDSDMSD